MRFSHIAPLQWVCDSGADYHMSGDINLFDFLDDVPSTFHVKQIKGKVPITKWGVVRLSTETHIYTNEHYTHMG